MWHQQVPGWLNKYSGVGARNPAAGAPGGHDDPGGQLRPMKSVSSADEAWSSGAGAGIYHGPLSIGIARSRA